MSVAKTRVAVLISGTGSNMASLIAAGQAADAPYEVVVVVSNIAGAGGLAKAEAAGVEALTVEHKPFGKDREAHERAIDALLVERGVQVVALAGYMRLLTPWLVGKWADRMLNIHPSLLPLYPGLNTHARAIEAGDVVLPADPARRHARHSGGTGQGGGARPLSPGARRFRSPLVILNDF